MICKIQNRNRINVSKFLFLELWLKGCEEKFPRLLIAKLDSLGFTVFATTRQITPELSENFTRHYSSNVKLLQCDLTNPRSLKETAFNIQRGLKGRDLWGLVTAACSSTNSETFEDRSRSNSLASAKLIKAFLPLLRRAKNSRVFFISNLNISEKHPLHAVARASERSFVCVLREELAHFDVHVSLFDAGQVEGGLSIAGSRRGSLLMPTVAEEPSNFNPQRRRSSLSNFIPCGRLDADTKEEIVEELARVLASPREPPLFLNGKI